jgi:hypothetical protein
MDEGAKIVGSTDEGGFGRLERDDLDIPAFLRKR